MPGGHRRQHRKDVSLGGELGVLARAVESIRILLDAELLDEPAPPERRLAAEAVAVLIAARLVQLRRAVLGVIDPAVLHAQHNEVIRSSGADPDVVLRARRG